MLPLLYLWNTKAMYLGPSFETREHSHNAIQVVIALDGDIRLKINGKWMVGTLFILAPNTKHQTTFLGNVAMLYIDAENARFKINSNQNLSISSELLKDLKDCYRSPDSTSGAEVLYYKLLNGIGELKAVSEAMDGRISKCLDYLNSNLVSDVSMEKICLEVGMSESSFSHLFTKEVGIPLRRFILWKRIKMAIYHFLNNSSSLTEAAFAAGFSDQAHFSKSFKDVFGISPTYIFGKKLKLLNSFNRLKISE